MHAVCLLIDPIVFMHLSRVCGTPNRLTMTCCRMRNGSVLNAGPPVTCLPSPVPVAQSSWFVSTTSRSSALAPLAATRSSECLRKQWQPLMGLKLRANALSFCFKRFSTNEPFCFACAATNTPLPNWTPISMRSHLVRNPTMTGQLKWTRF